MYSSGRIRQCFTVCVLRGRQFPLFFQGALKHDNYKELTKILVSFFFRSRRKSLPLQISCPVLDGREELSPVSTFASFSCANPILLKASLQRLLLHRNRNVSLFNHIVYLKEISVDISSAFKLNFHLFVKCFFIPFVATPLLTIPQERMEFHFFCNTYRACWYIRLFITFYWELVTAAQRERAQEDFKVLYQGAPPHPSPPPFAHIVKQCPKHT